MSENKGPSFKNQGSPLLESLRLAMNKQSKRKFSAASQDELVRLRLNGKHEIESIEIKDLGLSKKKEEALIFALKEAWAGAIEKAQRAARKDIVAGVKGESRAKARSKKASLQTSTKAEKATPKKSAKE